MKFQSLFRLLLLAVLLIGSFSVQAKAYRIELLAFAVGDQNTGEYWPANPGSPNRAKAQAVLTGSGDHGKATRLDRTLLRLGPEAYTVRKKGMPPVMHIGWMQSVRSRSKKDWFWLESGDLSGLVSVTVGRYLHLDLDLIYNNRGRPVRIKTHRRMRSNELHYLDHPLLGVLAEIRPVSQ